MSYTWIPFYKEFARKLLQFKDNRTPLVNWIYDNLDSNCIRHLKDDSTGKRLPDIDPLTVFAIFNRGITHEKRKDICQKFKDLLKIESPIPQDFDGIPVMNNQLSNFMAFEKDRKDGDIERLWQVFIDAVLDRNIQESYDALNGQYLIKHIITMGLFWIRPDKYLGLDGHNREKLSLLGIASFNGKFVPYREYEGIMKRLDEKMNYKHLVDTEYAEFSHTAYLKSLETNKPVPKHNDGVTYWTYSPGANASEWERCVREGIMCLGWDEIGDFKQYASPEDVRDALKESYSIDGSAKNSSLAVWQFANELKPGDIVFAKKGRNKIIGRGIVESDYDFDASRQHYKHFRKVHWTNKGEWYIDDAAAMKTLTNVTRYKDYVQKLNQLFDGESGGVSEPEEKYRTRKVNYWWLTGSPNYWSPSNDWKLGEDVDYTLYNEIGNKRRIFKHFIEAKPGDIVIAYEATPVLQIVAIGRVVSETDGEVLYIRKEEELLSPVPYSEILNNPILKDSEPVKNRCQGSLFSLTYDEYEEVMRLIRKENPEPVKEEYETYTKEDFLNEVYISADDYDRLVNLLLRKKNLILQGAPGVGKTFAAKRLAYAMMGVMDEDRVKQVQFHQSYSYEDFVMGYKPNGQGGFELKEGIFYNFCKRALDNPEKDYFFIIDEINRGNLSKIFGELLMLIENDYRDKSIQLAYKDEEFAVPTNLYIIGMMNTADRSLAMIDYALRRRFSFFEMKPGFENPTFEKEIQEKNDERLNHLIRAIIDLNKVIEDDDSLGSGFCIGHSYLCNLGTDYNLENIVEYDIIPMLREYWFDNDERFKQQAQNLRDAL